MIDNNLKTVVYDPMEWKESASCKGMSTEIFFPRQGEPNTTALLVCSTCVVRKECLTFALDNYERFGVWGGRSERQRRALRREE